jgi:hypothetical protein
MTMSEIERARLLELAVERALGGLTDEEELELERITGRHGVALDNSFERAAAAAELAAPLSLEELPADLPAKIATAADRYFAPIRSAQALRRRALAAERNALGGATWLDRLASLRGHAGWAVAAAMALVLLLRPAPQRGAEAGPSAAALAARSESRGEPTGGELRGTPEAGKTGSAVTPETLSPESGRDRDRLYAARDTAAARAAAADTRASDDPAAARAALIANRRFLLRRSWTAAGDASLAQVTGDVVWDAATQTGYMRFVGLRRNDPSTEEYQLWIFDGRRDPRYPVDGGVFDATGRGTELVVPIHAKLSVKEPQMFAITVERPGGVVVSDRERIVVIARIT